MIAYSYAFIRIYAIFNCIAYIHVGGHSMFATKTYSVTSWMTIVYIYTHVVKAIQPKRGSYVISSLIWDFSKDCRNCISSATDVYVFVLIIRVTYTLRARKWDPIVVVVIVVEVSTSHNATDAPQRLPSRACRNSCTQNVGCFSRQQLRLSIISCRNTSEFECCRCGDCNANSGNVCWIVGCANFSCETFVFVHDICGKCLKWNKYDSLGVCMYVPQVQRVFSSDRKLAYIIEREMRITLSMVDLLDMES